MIRRALLAWMLILACPIQARAQSDWARVQQSARGQEVYFNAWAGDPAINRYIAWAAMEVQRLYGVRLIHVKISDTAIAVSRILAEQRAGRGQGGSVDLIWINGQNFASLKNADLLYGPWIRRLPNFSLLDVNNGNLSVDSTLPTQGFELPWGGATFCLFYASTAVTAPVPRDPDALMRWIQRHPGRFTYPQPPDFLGTTFLKQLMLLMAADPARLYQPVGADFESVTAPLWRWLEAARPNLWRGGRIYPRGGSEQLRLLGDGEIDWLLSFNPSQANRAILAGELPPTIRGMYFSGAVLANNHFLAIPANANSKEGAMVIANFLVSPQAQARKADEMIWGDPSVLVMDVLAVKHGVAWPGIAAQLAGEPHPSWTIALATAWISRFGAQ